MKIIPTTITFVLLLTAVASCTITKSFDIQKQSIESLQNFYKDNNINAFLVAKDLNQFLNLGKIERLVIPSNIVFDKDGLEIVTFDKKLCSNHTLTFLKMHTDSLDYKKGNFTINEYLDHFEFVGENAKTIADIKKSKKICVFLNTASYGNLGGLGEPNKEAFTIYKEFGGKYDIYFVNVDYLAKWDLKTAE